MGKNKSAIKKKHRRMMQARREAHIELVKERAKYGGKMTIDELVYKTLHPYD